MMNARIPTNHGEQRPEEIVDYLTYCNYRHNRELGISPEGFKRMGFPDVDACEAKYQAEIAHEREMVRDGQIYVDEGYSEDLEACRESLRREP